MSEDSDTRSLEWKAWSAFDGDGDTGAIVDFVSVYRPLLGAISARLHGVVSREDGKVLADIHLVLVGLELSLAGKMPVRTLFEHARSGAPVNRHAIARKGHAAARLVERLKRLGWKQEAAIRQATETTGLGRSEIFVWLKKRKADRQLASALKVKGGEALPDESGEKEE